MKSLPRRLAVATITLLLLLPALPVSAEKAADPAPKPAYIAFDEGLGFSGGQLSGMGISYRTWKLFPVGFQLCLGAMYSPANADWAFTGDLLDYWAGVESFWSLYASEFTRWLFGQLYLFAALHHSAVIPWEPVEVTREETTAGETHTITEITGYQRGVFTPRVGIGAGFGVEVTLFSHFSGTFELGYGLFWQPSTAPFLDQLSVQLVPQGSFHFRY